MPGMGTGVSAADRVTRQDGRRRLVEGELGRCRRRSRQAGRALVRKRHGLSVMRNLSVYSLSVP